MKGVLSPDALAPLTSVSAWLNYAQPARQAVANLRAVHTDAEHLLAVAERNVVEQLGNLKTHPAVGARLEQGDLQIHGWMYHIGEGMVTSWDAGRDDFTPLRSAKTKLRAAR
jgi:carbonic anhydrase